MGTALGNDKSTDDSTNCGQAGVDATKHEGDGKNGPSSENFRDKSSKEEILTLVQKARPGCHLA